eukprot:775848-Pyramimonas_sp.AAC.1
MGCSVWCFSERGAAARALAPLRGVQSARGPIGELRKCARQPRAPSPPTSPEGRDRLHPSLS